MDPLQRHPSLRRPSLLLFIFSLKFVTADNVVLTGVQVDEDLVMKESIGGHNNTSAYALVYVDEHWRGTSPYSRSVLSPSILLSFSLCVRVYLTRLQRRSGAQKIIFPPT